jgi:ABC-2 type transport system ATP-binding protein
MQMPGADNTQTSTVISVKGLVKSYGERLAVNGIDFDVRRGEVFSLLGPNGAGKTTTVEILEGLRKPEGGKVSVLGMDPWRDGYILHTKIGVMPQGFRFFEKSTPSEAIVYYARLFGCNPDVGAILRIVELEDSADVPFDELSGGQKQKVGLALAMVNDPEVLFLDEPTTGLDPQARRAIWQVIRSFRDQRKSVLLTTHYMEEAEQLSDTVAIMNAGRIIAQGSPDSLIRRYGAEKKVQVTGGEELISHLKNALQLPIRSIDGRIEITTSGKGDILKAIAAVENSGLPYEELSIKKDSLEDVFISLVGRMKEGELS